MTAEQPQGHVLAVSHTDHASGCQHSSEIALSLTVHRAGEEASAGADGYRDKQPEDVLSESFIGDNDASASLVHV